MIINKFNNISSLFRSSEGLLCILLGCVWGYHLLVVINAVFLRLPGLKALGEYGRDIVIFILFLFSINAFKKRISQADILFCFLFLSFYIFQFIFYPDNQQYLLDNMFVVFLVSLPMYFLGYSLDINKLYDFLLVFSIGCILFHGFLSFIFLPKVGQVSDANNYSMGAAYRLLPHVLYVFWHSYKTRTIYGFAIFVLGMLLMITYGTRGPIVCVAFFIVSLLLSSGSRYKWWMKFLLVVAIVLVIVFFDWIVFFLDGFLSDVGGSTRLINKVYTETLDDDSGRGSIVNTLKNILDTGDKMSYGIFGSYRYVGGYAHRIYWDFWFSFGYVGGSIIMIILVALFINGLKKSLTSDEKVFWLLLFSNSIIALMFSGCYIISGPFYLFLGYCVSRIRKNKIIMDKIKALV